MYYEIKPPANSPHQLSEWLSRRGESTLEAFHNMLAHFGNCGMKPSLADNLNLTGTARHNVTIRHKMRVSKLDQQTRNKMPAAWEMVVPYFNHSELQHINNLAKEKGAKTLPFKDVEPLVEDTGEVFFHKYFEWLQKTNPPNDPKIDCCLCPPCVLEEANSGSPTGQPAAPEALLLRQTPAENQVRTGGQAPVLEPVATLQPAETPIPTSRGQPPSLQRPSVLPNQQPARQLPLLQQPTEIAPQTQPAPHQQVALPLPFNNQPTAADLRCQRLAHHPLCEHQHYPQQHPTHYQQNQFPSPQCHQAQLLPACFMQPHLWSQFNNRMGTNECCCPKFQRYSQRGRIGRPPHNRNCQRRSRNRAVPGSSINGGAGQTDV